MNGNGKDVLRTALNAGQNYCNTLRELEDTTDGLIEAIRTWDVDGVQSLVDRRAQLCDKAGGALASFIQETDKWQREAGLAISPELESIFEWTQTEGDSILTKQTECEKLLAEGLRERRSSLLGMSKRRGLRAAYRKPAGQSPAAKFLDNRL
jgi:hypothetical protein